MGSAGRRWKGKRSELLPKGQEKNRFDQEVALKNRLNWEGHLSLDWRTLPFCPPMFDGVFSVFQDRR